MFGKRIFTHLPLEADPALIAAVRLYYQPVVRLADARADYAEVLVRAAGDDGAVLGPETIVEAMTGADVSLDLTAAIIARALSRPAAGLLPLAINLPLDALLHPRLIARIEALREAAGLAAHLLRFELTETHPVHDLVAARAGIAALRAAGHDLALDDITPDMPNLAALMEMDITAVKLDRSVVVAANEGFIRDVVACCAPRGLLVVAEGIETPPQAAQMQALGATHGQGFLFARPLSAAALRAFLHHD
jgi:EAL domain-containing protein (putative c-di-GMP-specific phosphodiesterase class I)